MQWSGIHSDSEYNQGIANQTIILLYYIRSVIYHIRISHPCQFLSDIPNLHTHANFTVFAFLSVLVVIVLNLLPGLYYVYSHYALNVESELGPVPMAKSGKMAMLITAWLMSGLTRRGPLLRYNEIKLGTGFGVSATKNVEVDLNGPNVMDWAGCPMLKLVTLSQVSVQLESANDRIIALRVVQLKWTSYNPPTSRIWRNLFEWPA